MRTITQTKFSNSKQNCTTICNCSQIYLIFFSQECQLCTISSKPRLFLSDQNDLLERERTDLKLWFYKNMQVSNPIWIVKVIHVHPPTYHKSFYSYLPYVFWGNIWLLEIKVSEITSVFSIYKFLLFLVDIVHLNVK